jgi:hypothetical protein
MKIVKIIGGLGNQMFQFAFLLSLQKKGLNAKLDLFDFSKHFLHNGFELERIFPIDGNYQIATLNEINSVKDSNQYFKIRKILGIILLSNPNRFIRSTHFIQSNFSHFYDNLFTYDDKYLDGYWQNEKYLIGYESEIKKLFQWLDVDKRNRELATTLNNENSVSVHVRRLDSPKNIKELIFAIRLRIVWRIASKKYYLNAIDYLKSKVKNPHFYFFTDDINWVKRHIKLDTNYTIIDWNRKDKSHLDMFLMTQCQHNIISMSSYSWWGAWLNKNPYKIVIAPKKWAPRFTNDEIIPKKWIRL